MKDGVDPPSWARTQVLASASVLHTTPVERGWKPCPTS